MDVGYLESLATLRISAIEGQLYGRFNVPTIFFYPGERTGKTRLKFLGFYPDVGITAPIMSVGDGAPEGQMFRGSDQRTWTMPGSPVIPIDLLALIAQGESEALEFKRSAA